LLLLPLPPPPPPLVVILVVVPPPSSWSTVLETLKAAQLFNKFTARQCSQEPISGLNSETNESTPSYSSSFSCWKPAICRWICAMLESRNVSATLSGETLGAAAARGCPQGGVRSPLLRSLVVDDLLWGLNSNGYYTVGYADDKAILISEKFPQTVRGLTNGPVHSPAMVRKNEVAHKPK
jgi:hypothetical protein